MSFKYDVLGKIRFGFELEDILKLKGVKDIESFLNPTIENTESELLFENIEKARDVFVKHIKNQSIIDLLVDCDADMIIFNNDFCIDHVIANGRVMVEDGKVLVYGSYE